MNKKYYVTPSVRVCQMQQTAILMKSLEMDGIPNAPENKGDATEEDEAAVHGRMTWGNIW